jgi:hypothetical protein
LPEKQGTYSAGGLVLFLSEGKMNMNYWNKMKQPPVAALKKISGGRLSGMTDIKPQWRTQIMTEVFGPCGIGWKYEVKKLWTHPGTDEQVFAFADIDLWFKHEGEWSEAIPGHGGSMLVAKEKGGLHSSDEAFKMAITDALSTAMKAIGVAADVYLGNWDGSKYTDIVTPTNLTPEQVAELEKLIEDTQTDIKAFLKFAKANTIADIHPTKYAALKTALMAKKGKS